jgi:hypothetical protein
MAARIREADPKALSGPRRPWLGRLSLPRRAGVAHPGDRLTALTATGYTRSRRQRSGAGCVSCWLRSVRWWRVFRSGAGGDSGNHHRPAPIPESVSALTMV